MFSQGQIMRNVKNSESFLKDGPDTHLKLTSVLAHVQNNGYLKHSQLSYAKVFLPKKPVGSS